MPSTWSYSLCWASVENPRYLPHIVRLGNVQLHGPHTRDYACTLGLQCNPVSGGDESPAEGAFEEAEPCAVTSVCS